MLLKFVGLGVGDGSNDGDSIAFCLNDNNRDCYSSQNYINSDAGKADYAALLTAQATGLKVTFYCDTGGYAKNIHIVR
ncbi:Uncharacterised protein [Serratia ficaria]|nr:Uncharacterised protein [Serratia ficaria]CAI2463981.1 Uncharacterised protein [Serratia ficaria]